jgi:hypothetical protein
MTAAYAGTETIGEKVLLNKRPTPRLLSTVRSIGLLLIAANDQIVNPGTFSRLAQQTITFQSLPGRAERENALNRTGEVHRRTAAAKVSTPSYGTNF